MTDLPHIDTPAPLLGGLTPAQFMQRHWQKKPLVVHGAMPGFKPVLTRAALFSLAASDAAESRLVWREGEQWHLRRGPFKRLPPVKSGNWTVLVQGVDLHSDAARALLEQFRFIPDARLDDLMISYAADGGGVGPHFDSYDVFLLQAQGRRRWRIGRQKNRTLIEGLPVKILAQFEPEQEHLMAPGDLLYLPPGWAHDGVAEGECVTCSAGFRQPVRAELAREVLLRLADDCGDLMSEAVYRDPRQSATAQPGAMPPAMLDFARAALDQALAALAKNQGLLQYLGETLTEPKPTVWFEARGEDEQANQDGGIALDRKTRMLYGDTGGAHSGALVFINGESFRASGADAALMRRLADRRTLTAAECKRLSADARELIGQWREAGWLHGRG
ncbi:MAG: cupin domain-containing protein [Burkholderiaceae bacterium]|jgi:50S ribosomal protein L16 3-hydroxylase|nr:cupin domain-containing protein [Burkholderiaceae bacterium]